MAPPRHEGGFRLAHLSDPHLTEPTGVPWGQLLNKRLGGYLSWRRRRRHVHSRERLALLMRDLATQGADHIAVTGDLTHIGTPRECREALAWLRELGDPDRVSVVPGNHDAYVRAPYAETVGLWDEYMAGDSGGGFPFVRRRGPLALIGLSSAVPCGIPFATGRLGDAQRRRLAAALTACRWERACRVLLIHHPPQANAVTWRRRLVDGDALREVLAQDGVELVLHGHAHRRIEGSVAVPGGRAPVVGVSSASAVHAEEHAVAAYNLIDIRAAQEGWRMVLRRRLIHPDATVTACAPAELTGAGSVEPAH